MSPPHSTRAPDAPTFGGSVGDAAVQPSVLPECAPMFLVGCPRSGTTVFASLFQSTRWGVPFETHFIPKYASRLGADLDLSTRPRFRKVVRRILAERPVRELELDVDLDRFYDELPAYDYASVVNAICYRARRGRGYASWADKTPHYVLELDLLSRLFPESKFLVLVRDGRDVALSLLRKPWGPTNVYACAKYWRECTQKSAALVRLRETGRALELRYEDFLDRPEEIARAALRFLGEDPDSPAVIRWIDRLRRGNHTKWKDEMSASDIRLFEEVAGDALRMHGYECSVPPGRRVPASRRAAHTATDLLRRSVHLARLNLVDGLLIRLGRKRPFAE